MFRINHEDSPVFVQLSAHGLVRNVALPPNEERALVVGSTGGAALRLKGVGIAPVQFHLERHKGAIWLVPAYRIEDLRLNGATVLGPVTLDAHGVIEFAGIRVEVTIRDAETFAASGIYLSDDPSKSEFGPQYSTKLPGEADSTQVAMPPIATSNRSEDDWSPSEPQPASLRHEGEPIAVDNVSASSSRIHVTQRIEHERFSGGPNSTALEFTLSGTQIIPAYQAPRTSMTEISGVALIVRNPKAHARSGIEEDRRVFQTARLFTEPEAILTRPTENKRAEPLAPNVTRDSSRAVAPPPLGRHPLSLLTSDDEPHHRFGAERTASFAVRKSLLVRLGLLTKARPLLVGCFTGVGAALLTIFLLAATRLVSPRPARPSAPRTPLQVEVNSLRPATPTPTLALTQTATPTSTGVSEVARPCRAVLQRGTVKGTQSSAQATSAEPPRAKALY